MTEDEARSAPAERSAPAGWLLTIAQLPIEDPAARMRVLRTLESLGAAVMREGVYLLPDTDGQPPVAATRSPSTSSRSAAARTCCTSPPPRSTQQEEFQRLFDRSARYENLIKTVESLRVGFGQSDPSAISRVVHKQRREFESIAALDFFPTASRARAQASLAAADAEVKKLLFPTQSQTALAPGEALLGRTWVTRKPLWADRLACAWLIRRFVDPEATPHVAGEDPAAARERDQLRLRGRALHQQRDARHLRGDARPPRPREESRAVQDRQHRALPRGARHAGRRSRRRADPAAGRAAALDQRGRAAREAEKTFDLLYEAYYQPPKDAS